MTRRNETKESGVLQLRRGLPRLLRLEALAVGSVCILCAVVAVALAIFTDRTDVVTATAVSAACMLHAVPCFLLGALEKRIVIDAAGKVLTSWWQLVVPITRPGHEPLSGCRVVAIQARGLLERFAVYLDGRFLARFWTYRPARALAEQIAVGLRLEVWVVPQWPGVVRFDPDKPAPSAFRLQCGRAAWEAAAPANVQELPGWLTLKTDTLQGEIGIRAHTLCYLLTQLVTISAVGGITWVWTFNPNVMLGTLCFCGATCLPLVYATARGLHLRYSKETFLLTEKWLTVETRSVVRRRVRRIAVEEIEQIEVCPPLLRDGYVEFSRIHVLSLQGHSGVLEMGYNLQERDLELLRDCMISVIVRHLGGTSVSKLEW